LFEGEHYSQNFPQRLENPGPYTTAEEPWQIAEERPLSFHGKRSPERGPEVSKMGTDWFIKGGCPHPNGEINSREERVKACLECPFVIWENPVTVAGFMKSMCGVRVGRIGRAAELDDLGEDLTGIAYFTKENSSPSMKLKILEEIKEYAERNAWSLSGFSPQETMEHLDLLIEFCERAEKKELAIHSWA
jgi:hypothetical protein